MSRRHGRIEQFDLRRRALLWGISAFATFAATLRVAPAWARPVGDIDYLLIEAAVNSIRDTKSANVIWRAFQATYPRQGKNDVLPALRQSLRDLGEEHVYQSLSSLVTSLKRAIRSDFAEGRVLELNGWILSPTEVRLCALASGRWAS